VRPLRWLGAALLPPLLAIAGLAGWLLGTESGLRFAVGQLEARGWLSAEAVRGRLLGTLELEQAALHASGLDLAVERLRLDWHPEALLHGQLHVRELTARGVRIGLPPTEADGPAEPYGGMILPLGVRIDHLRVEQVSLAQPSPSPSVGRVGEGKAADPPLIHHLEAKATLEGGVLRLARLDLDTPWATMQAQGSLDLAPTGPVDLALEWTAPREGLKAPLAGSGRLTGTLQRLALDQRIGQPTTARLVGVIEPFSENLDWQAVLTADALAPERLVDGLPALGAWATRIDATGDMDGARLQALELTQGERRLHGEGRVDWAGALTVDARLDWQALAWPLTGTPRIESPSGRLTLSGPPSGYTLDGAARLIMPGQPPADVTLRGTGDLEHLNLAALSVRTMDGEILARGDLRWTPALSWQADLVARNVHPEALLPAWPGALHATARTHGEIRDGQPQARIEVERLHGTLRGYPFEARVLGDLSGAELAIEQFELHSGQSHVTATGKVGDALDLQAKLDSPDLAELLPGAGGALKGEARLAGTLETPRLKADLEGRMLRWQTFALDRATLKADGAFEGDQPLDLLLDASGLRRSGLPLLESARVTLGGSAANHPLRIDMRQGRRGADLHLAGQGRWDGALERLTLSEGKVGNTPLGDWRSLAPAELVAGADRIELPRWCWGQGEARLCLEGRRTPERAMSAGLDLERFDLARLDRWLAKKPLRLSGMLTAEARLDAPTEGPLIVTAKARGEQAIIRVPGKRRGEWLDMPLEQAHLDIRMGGGEGRLDAALRMNASNRIEARMRLPGHRLEDGAAPDQPLEGVAEIHFNDPRMLAGLVPPLKDPRGVLAGRVNMAGTLGRPLLFGGAQLSEASVVLPDLGIRVEDGQLQLNAGPDHRMTLKGGAKLGEGLLAIDGTADLANLPDWRAEVRLKGDNLTALRLPEASLQASPDLRIRLKPHETRLEGKVVVPEALFDIAGGGPAAPSISDDVRILGEEDEAGRAHAIHTRLEVLLGDTVRVRGRGFNGRIGGRLVVIDRPDLPGPIGQGELTIPEGRYKAYGQDLQIEKGRIIYADTPLDDPALDIRAVRRGIQDNVVAGVRITGRASKPELVMFSEPAMEQAEVLAYLVTGKSLKKGTGGDASLMIQAARSAGFAGGDLLAGQIGSAFGLEEAAIESDTGTRELSLVLGRYLTPRLYLRYVQGLEAGLHTFVLRYELTRRIHVQVQSGVKAGVDVFYSIER